MTYFVKTSDVVGQDDINQILETVRQHLPTSTVTNVEPEMARLLADPGNPANIEYFVENAMIDDGSKWYFQVAISGKLFLCNESRMEELKSRTVLVCGRCASFLVAGANSTNPQDPIFEKLHEAASSRECYPRGKLLPECFSELDDYDLSSHKGEFRACQVCGCWNSNKKIAVELQPLGE